MIAISSIVYVFSELIQGEKGLGYGHRTAFCCLLSHEASGPFFLLYWCNLLLENHYVMTGFARGMAKNGLNVSIET